MFLDFAKLIINLWQTETSSATSNISNAFCPETELTSDCDRNLVSLFTPFNLQPRFFFTMFQ